MDMVTNNQGGSGMRKIFLLAGACVLTAVVYGIRYGWLAAHTQWVIGRMTPREQ